LEIRKQTVAGSISSLTSGLSGSASRVSAMGFAPLLRGP
jgi:hypothetical protein